MALAIRPARPEDAARLAEIYGWHALHGTGTFDEAEPSAADMAARLAEVEAAGLPWRVAEEDGRAIGYACARPYIERSGYRFTCQDSVFVAHEAVARGVGRALLSAVIDAAALAGRREMVALIGDSGNAGSIGLHTALGFRHVGVLQRVGLKHGRWLDVVLMQLSLAAHPASTAHSP